MWLINIHDNLKLEFIANPKKDSYAILSLTWEEEEVSFQQFSDIQSARKLRGFAKIEYICRLAEEDKLQYVWVDTCCIDKTSSAELSEAINSMFSWYQGAAVCYVYISDFVWSPHNWDPAVFQEQLSRCRWFTRGWTLQELLAPKRVEFYDKNWTFFNTRNSWLQHYISDVTGIEEVYLERPQSIWSAPVGVRMRWISRRKTTRPEDMAYCLLGIFNINMPLIYGEGEKAFTRLQEEICKQTNDLSLFAW
ncbi:hypothetical protein M426DRAFT_57508, partial [Hypoxylon sp. CI-4A]